MNTNFKHRCYTQQIRGKVVYELESDWDGQEFVWCKIEVLDQFHHVLDKIREDFEKNYGIKLELWKNYHISVLRGQRDDPLGIFHERSKCIEGDEVEVWITEEVFWWNKYCWVNAWCEKAHWIKMAFGIDDEKDPENWGHITIGEFSDGKQWPIEFKDYGNQDRPKQLKYNPGSAGIVN